VNKKLIIMTAAAGLVSFGGAFAFAWLTKPAPAGGREISQEPTVAGQGAELTPGQPEALADAIGGKMKRTMTEKQLKSLVSDIRAKMQEYSDKLKSLRVREQRLQRVHNLVKNDIEELNNLRIELASAVAKLRSERDKLLESRVEIAQAEKANLILIAATYDKMKAEGASKILTNLSKMKTGNRGDNLNDAVKILHYMGERTRAKLLAELTTSEPQLAALLCQRLKQIIEEE
jgi:flagellar motility protein MotE (MotC chaperone)